MATRPTQLRIPPELLEQIDAAAEAVGVTRTAWLIEAAKDRLAASPRDGGIVKDIERDMRTVLKAKAGDPSKVVTAEPLTTPARPFKCPVDGCKMTAGSPAAVCGDHGRKVVPA